MTTRTTLIALRDRVRDATGPDRELERDLHEVVAGECTHRETRYYAIEDGNSVDSGFTCLACDEDTYGKRGWPSYTRSLDAALSLVERCLPGWSWSVDTMDRAGGQDTWSWAQVRPADAFSSVFYRDTHPVPCLALLSAMLEALIASEPEEEAPTPKSQKEGEDG
jgi:hypothetical protein